MTAAEVIAKVVRPHVELGNPEPDRFDDRVKLRTEIAEHVSVAILAALRGAGFAVVPREANTEMLQAAFAVEPQALKQFRKRIDCLPSDIAAMHRAMVAAAKPRTGGE